MPVVYDFIAIVITNSAIKLTWSPPDTEVKSYNINRRCRRVCESSFTSNSETSVSSPHTSTGIPPYSQCGFDLIGIYENDIRHFLTTNHFVTTLSTGKIKCKNLMKFCFFSLQPLLHQWMILYSHQ